MASSRNQGAWKTLSQGAWQDGSPSTWFIDNEHSGTDAGTQSNPFQTFSALWASVIAQGDTIYVKATDTPYREVPHAEEAEGSTWYMDWTGTGTTRGSTQALFYGSLAVSTWSVYSGDTYSATFTDAAGTFAAHIYGGDTHDYGVWYLESDGTIRILTKGSAAGSLAADEFFWDESNTLYVNVSEDPDTGQIEAAARQHVQEFYTGESLYGGIYRYGIDGQNVDGDGTDGWLVEGAEFSHNANYGLLLEMAGSDICYFRRNSVHHNMGRGVQPQRTDDVFKLELSWSLIYSNGLSGIYHDTEHEANGTATNWSKIYNCTIYNNNTLEAANEGGLYITDSLAYYARVYADNNLSTSNYGYEFYAEDAAAITLDHASNNGYASASDTTGGKWSSSDDVTSTIGFKAASTGDFRLSTQAQMNTGRNAVWSGTADISAFDGTEITDSAGTITCGTVDIGAYEQVSAAVLSSFAIPRSGIQPSYPAGFARSAAESANPGLWRGLVGAWVPALGVTGGTLHDVSGRGNDVTAAWSADETSAVITDRGLAYRQDVVVHPSTLAHLARTIPSATVVLDVFFDSAIEELWEYIYDARVDSGIGYAYWNSASEAIGVSSGTVYIDSAVGSVASKDVWHSVAIAGTALTVDTSIALLKKADRYGQNFRGNYLSIKVYDRVLSLPEIQHLHRDPLAPFRLAPLYISIPAEAGGDTTLEAGSGSYGITGSTAGLLYSPVIAPATGDYAVTGTAASLLYGSVLAAATGEYEVTGSDADLIYADFGPVQIASILDDGYQKADGSGFNTNADNVIFNSWSGDESERSYGFLRFGNVAIPQGATIDSVDLQVYFNVVSGAVDVRIHCEDVDDADNLSDTANIVDRDLTEAYSTWDPADPTSDAWVSVADPKAAVEEVVARGTWSSGNALAFVLVGQTTSNAGGLCRSRDYDTGLGAKLSVMYTEETAYTLDCATGTYGITGSTTGLLYSPVITAASGDYAATGTDATLTHRAHAFYNHDNSTQTAGSESTETAITSVAADGVSWVMFLVVNNADDTAISLSGESLSGTDAADFNIAKSLPGTLDSVNDATFGSNRTARFIQFQPTSSGTKDAVYNLTVDGVAYSVPIQGVCTASTSVAIGIVEGVTPSGYSRTAPCPIFAYVDMDNTDISCRWSECYFRWKVTGPNNETFPITDCRTYDGSTSRDLFDHYSGCVICIPVLEGQHGDWKIDLDVFMPGDDGDDPGVSATQVTVAVSSLASGKTTYYCSATGAGSHDGSSGNEWTWAEAKSALEGVDNWHLIVASGETMTSPGDNGMYLADAKNWSIVGGGTGSNRPIIRPNATGADHRCFRLGIGINFPKSGWVQDLILQPYPTGGVSTSNTAVATGYAKSTAFYQCLIDGDGVTAGSHDGDSFSTGYFLESMSAGSVTQGSDCCKGFAVIKGVSEPTNSFGIWLNAFYVVEVGNRIKASVEECCLRSGGDYECSPYQGNYGMMWYNAVDTEHDMLDDDDGSNPSKQGWRFAHGQYITLHRCHADCGNWMSMQAKQTFDVRLDGCDFHDIPAGASPIDRQGWCEGVSVVCSSLRRSYTHHQYDPRPFDLSNTEHGVFAHCTMNVTGGVEDYTISKAREVSQMLYMSTIAHDFGNQSAYTETDSIANNIFPATYQLDYDADGETHTSVALLNASDAGTGNAEVDITIDADGRPNEDASGYGRGVIAYYDYHMRAMTSATDWVGMAQSDAAITMEAATGTYGITGSEATLTYTPVGDFSIDADTGVYGVTGSTAGLLYSPELAAATGTYAITGVDATLTYTPVGSTTLTADTGIYGITGSTAGLLHGHVMAVETGSYAVTGSDAGLQLGQSMVVATGTYAITGVDADLLLDYVLAALAGSYAVTGATATLTYSGEETGNAMGMTAMGVFEPGLSTAGVHEPGFKSIEVRP